MKAKILALFLGSLIPTSCGITKTNQDNTSNTSSIYGNQWRIVELDGKAINGLVNNTTPYVSFDKKDNRYAVITGCNTLAGDLELSKNKIKLKTGISTMMYCEDMRVEDSFKKIMDNISSYKLDNNELHLIGSDKQVKVKLKSIDANVAALADGEWELNLLAEPGVNFQALFPNNKPTIKFGKDGNVTGHSGCNRYTGTYKLDGSNVNFGAMAGTKMMCPSLEGENTYLKALSKVNKLSVRDNELTMIMGDIAILRFKKK